MAWREERIKMREEPIKSNPPTLMGVQVDITRPLDHCASRLELPLLSVICICHVHLSRASVMCICHVHLSCASVMCICYVHVSSASCARRCCCRGAEVFYCTPPHTQQGRAIGGCREPVIQAETEHRALLFVQTCLPRLPQRAFWYMHIEPFVPSTCV